MSLKMITRVSELDFKSKHLLKYVLFALANHADADGEAWPSYPTIAKFCSVDEKTARRSVNKLIELGYLIKTNRTHSNGRTTSNLYKINLEGGANSPGEGDCVPPQRGTNSPPSKENLQKEPSKEHIREVFEFWKETIGKPKSTMDSKRETAIKNRLKNHSVEEIKLAIKGATISPHHRGENKDKKKYQDIELICRSEKSLEDFIDWGRKEKSTSDQTYVSPWGVG